MNEDTFVVLFYCLLLPVSQETGAEIFNGYTQHLLIGSLFHPREHSIWHKEIIHWNSGYTEIVRKAALQSCRSAQVWFENTLFFFLHFCAVLESKKSQFTPMRFAIAFSSRVYARKYLAAVAVWIGHNETWMHWHRNFPSHSLMFCPPSPPFPSW